MKKIYTILLVGTVFSSSIFAQGIAQPATTNNFRQVMTGPLSTALIPKHTNVSSERAAETYWLNYAAAANDIYGGLSTLSGNYLFQDSIPYALFGSGYDRPWIHMLGDVLDVTAGIWSANTYSIINWDDNQPYSVDSMGIVCTYSRNNANASIVDTLMVYLYTDVTAANLGTLYFNPPYAQNFGGSATDTLWLKAQYYDYLTNKPKTSTGAIASLTVVKVPLTKNDTSVTGYWGYKDWSVGTAFNVPAGKLVASAITFKPGYSYSNNDTLNNNLNQFNFGSYEENGANSVMNFNQCVNPKAMCDWNVSSIVNTGERYNTAAKWSGGGLMVPSWAYATGYGFEHHAIYYKVTQTGVGINEASASDNIAFLGNSPNPFKGNTSIEYRIVNPSEVVLSIFDATGKKVMELKEGKQSFGKHSININASNLSAGVYYYTLKAGESSFTKKMVVVE